MRLILPFHPISKEYEQSNQKDHNNNNQNWYGSNYSHCEYCSKDRITSIQSN